MGNVKRSLAPGKNGVETDLVLVANGSSGPWEVAIDESIGKPERLFAHVEGPCLYLYFQIPSRETILSALRFLEHRTKTVRLGGFGRSSINLVWDTEFADRCFLIIGVSRRPSVQLTLTSNETEHLQNALRQVQSDLA